MVKLTISLPNNTQIMLEAEEAEIIKDVLGRFLRGMAMDAMFDNAPGQEARDGRNGTGEKCTDTLGWSEEGWNEGQAIQPPSRPVNGAAHRQGVNGASHQDAVSGANGSSGSPVPPGSENGGCEFNLPRQSRQSLEGYAAFCQSLNPMGDMRRVVVAAEAANRFFGLDGVSADDLGELFDLAGWRRANSFTQTLRNAARSKFGWLERIPGRSGRYAATDLGRSITLAG